MPLTLLLAQLLVTSPAVAIQVIGSVDFETAKGKQALARFDEVPEGATIETHTGARTTLRLASGSMLRLGPDTRVELSQLVHGTPAAQRREKVKLVVGRLWARVMGLMGGGSHFEVETANAVAGVRGTAFWAASDGTGDQFVLEDGSLLLHRGSQTTGIYGRGARVMIGAGGIFETGQLAWWQLDGLRLDVGGPAAQMLFHTDPREIQALGAPLGQDSFRHDVNTPDSVGDTSIFVARPSEELRGIAEVTIKLRLPN